MLRMGWDDRTGWDDCTGLDDWTGWDDRTDGMIDGMIGQMG